MVFFAALTSAISLMETIVSIFQDKLKMKRIPACILVLGVVQLGIPYVLYALASRDCPPLACSLIGMLEPLLNPVWVLIFAGEVPGVFALAGACVIIGVVTWWCIADGKTQTENA